MPTTITIPESNSLAYRVISQDLQKLIEEYNQTGQEQFVVDYSVDTDGLHVTIDETCFNRPFADSPLVSEYAPYGIGLLGEWRIVNTNNGSYLGRPLDTISDVLSAWDDSYYHPYEHRYDWLRGNPAVIFPYIDPCDEEEWEKFQEDDEFFTEPGLIDADGIVHDIGMSGLAWGTWVRLYHDYKNDSYMMEVYPEDVDFEDCNKI